MKRLEFLINDVRGMSNIDVGSYSDDLLSLYFNEAQKTIRDIIFLANNGSNILKGDPYEIQLVNGVREYPLPERVYAENSILSVKASYREANNDRFYALRYLSIKDYETEYGYSLLNKSLLLSTVDKNSSPLNKLLVYYNVQLPKLGVRSGKVDSILGNDITFDTSVDLLMSTKTDYLSFVDKDGNQQKTDVELVEQVGPVVTVDDATGISVGDYVVIGEFSTTNSELPIDCEDYLRKYVERRVASGDSASKAFSFADIYTESEKNNIAEIFAQSSDDAVYPVTSPETVYL